MGSIWIYLDNAVRIKVFGVVFTANITLLLLYREQSTKEGTKFQVLINI